MAKYQNSDMEKKKYPKINKRNYVLGNPVYAPTFSWLYVDSCPMNLLMTEKSDLFQFS